MKLGLSPNSGNSLSVFIVGSGGYVSGYGVTYTFGVRPVVYLKSDVKILDDDMDGSSGHPYNLVLE